ncbi:MAG: site-specific integrase, partial [Thermoflexales bacterium]|nr:site-specific integrase [Thermoflexales bacterium]
ALRWRDVGLGGAAITVRETAKWVNGRWVFNPPKTASGARTVLLPQAMREALQRLLARRPDAAPEDFVFAGRRTDAPMGYTTAHTQLAAVCKRAGLPRIRIHDLRHLHASLLLAEGVPVPEVAARLGHANPSVTLRLYAHAVRGQQASLAAMERVTQPARRE